MYSDKFEARLRLIGVLSASRGSGCKFFFLILAVNSGSDLHSLLIVHGNFNLETTD